MASASTAPKSAIPISKSPFPKDWRGFIPNPRAYIYHLAPRTGRLNGLAQMFVIQMILDRTWGQPDSPEWAPISMQEFHRQCSEGKETRHTERCVLDLERRHIIASITAAEARKLGLNNKKQSKVKWYKATIEFWETAPKWEPKKFEAAVPEPEEQDQPEPEEQDQPAVVAVPVGQPLVFLPGRKGARPFTFSAPVPKISFRSECSYPVTVDPQQGRSCIEFVFKDADPESKGLNDGHTGVQTGVNGHTNGRMKGEASDRKSVV